MCYCLLVEIMFLWPEQVLSFKSIQNPRWLPLALTGQDNCSPGRIYPSFAEMTCFYGRLEFKMVGTSRPGHFLEAEFKPMKNLSGCSNWGNYVRVQQRLWLSSLRNIESILYPRQWSLMVSSYPFIDKKFGVSFPGRVYQFYPNDDGIIIYRYINYIIISLLDQFWWNIYTVISTLPSTCSLIDLGGGQI